MKPFKQFEAALLSALNLTKEDIMKDKKKDEKKENGKGYPMPKKGK